MEIPTLEMSLINCEANCTLTWSSTCVITNSTSKGKSAITDTKLYFQLYLYQHKIMQTFFDN